MPSKVFWERGKSGVDVCAQLFSSDPPYFIAEFFKLLFICIPFEDETVWSLPSSPKFHGITVYLFFPLKIPLLGSLLSEAFGVFVF